MTTITDPASPVVQAIFLKAHLRMLSVGMKNSRLSGTDILKKASAVTGKTYKRGQYVAAIKDLQQLIDDTFSPEEN